MNLWYNFVQFPRSVWRIIESKCTFSPENRSQLLLLNNKARYFGFELSDMRQSFNEMKEKQILLYFLMLIPLIMYSIYENKLTENSNIHEIDKEYSTKLKYLGEKSANSIGY